VPIFDPAFAKASAGRHSISEGGLPIPAHSCDTPASNAFIENRAGEL